MNFTDTIKVQALVFEKGYAAVGDAVFPIVDGVISNIADKEKTAEYQSKGMYDEKGNPLEPMQEWVAFGKQKNAAIFPNSRANKIILADGQDFIYSYEVVAKLKRSLYHLLPKEGDHIWIAKADGTIDKEMEVKGFVTLKQRYLRLWL